MLMTVVLMPDGTCAKRSPCLRVETGSPNPSTTSTPPPTFNFPTSITTIHMSAAWVWDAEQGVYYHSPSGSYAMPSRDGGEWTYLTAEEMATSRSTSKEEGEVDDDVGWGGLMEPEKLAAIVESSSSKAYEPPPDPADSADRILRLVVMRSKALEVGGVVVLDTREGGIQLGRDRALGKTPRVRVKEMEVSKTHALVYYGTKGREPRFGRDVAPEPEGWWILDLGSTLGTYVAHRGEEKATRLSETKEASRPYELLHSDKVTVGTTTFVVHIHQDWPCTECQFSGNVQIALDDGVKEPEPEPERDPAAKRGQKHLNRKIEMARLRDTLLGDERPKRKHEGYVDRSAQRRKLHPSSPPRKGISPANNVALGPRDGGYRSTTTISAPAGPSTVAREMLAKQGWAPGRGLGKDGSGRAEALEPVMRSERAGLGARGELADTAGGDWKTRAKERRWGEAGG